MWICNKCGETRRDDEMKTVQNWSYAEIVDYSCVCGGEYEEARKCPICGDYITPDKIVCDECAEDNATVENAIEYGDDCKTEIALNAFLVYMFPPSVIERILTEVMQNSADKNEQARKFCFEDKEAYEDFVIYKKLKEKK